MSECVSVSVCVCVQCVISVSRLTSESVDTSRCGTWLSVQVKTDTVWMSRKECSPRNVWCFPTKSCSVWSVSCFL